MSNPTIIQADRDMATLWKCRHLPRLLEDAPASLEQAFARHREQAVAEKDAQLSAIMRHVPMDYLKRHDVPGATGPTAALNLGAAMQDYAEDRWRLLDRLREKDKRIADLEAESARLRAFIRGIADSKDVPTCQHRIKAAIAALRGGA